MKKYLALVLAFSMVLSFGIAQPGHAEVVKEVEEAAKRLYIRVIPPGKRQVQTVAFCSSSFYKVPEEELNEDEELEKSYGITAGHCTSLYKLMSHFMEKAVWGLNLQLAISPDNSGDRFIPVEVEDYGMKVLVERRIKKFEGEEDEIPKMPDPEKINDWAVISVADTEFTKLKIAKKNSVKMADRVYTAGFPLALGLIRAQGDATPNYQIPGMIYDDYLATTALSVGGQSGSAVTNKKGELVGILVAGIPGGGPSLATPIRKIDFPHEDKYDVDEYAGKSYAGSGPYSVQNVDKVFDKIWNQFKKEINQDTLNFLSEKQLDEVKNRVIEIVKMVK